MKKRHRQDIITQLLKRKDEESAITINEIFQHLITQGFEGSDRTIRRDIEELSASAGIVSTEEVPERFYINKDYSFLHNLELNEESLQTVLIALNSLKKTSHEYFEESATQAENAIYAALAPDIEASLRQTKERYFFDFSMAGRPTNDNNKDFQKIMQAIRTNRIITCRNLSPYKKENHDEIKRVAPYRFILAAGIPYLLVEDQKIKKIKTYRMCRVVDVELTEDKFDPREISDSDIPNFIGGWGATEERPTYIEFHCKEAMGTFFLEKKIHHSQKVIKVKRGQYKVTLNCAMSTEITRLLASFGPQLISVSPRELYDNIVDIFEEGLEAMKVS